MFEHRRGSILHVSAPPDSALTSKLTSMEQTLRVSCAQNLGLSLVFVAGLMKVSICLPPKYGPKWTRVNTWGVCSFLPFDLVPWPLAFLTVSQTLEAYTAPSMKTKRVPFATGWGAASLFLGSALASPMLTLGNSSSSLPARSCSYFAERTWAASKHNSFRQSSPAAPGSLESSMNRG
jgi:hypothetical protein